MWLETTKNTSLEWFLELEIIQHHLIRLFCHQDGVCICLFVFFLYLSRILNASVWLVNGNLDCPELLKIWLPYPTSIKASPGVWSFLSSLKFIPATQHSSASWCELGTGFAVLFISSTLALRQHSREKWRRPCLRMIVTFFERLLMSALVMFVWTLERVCNRVRNYCCWVDNVNLL